MLKGSKDVFADLKAREDLASDIHDALKFGNGKSDDYLVQQVIDEVEKWTLDYVKSNLFRKPCKCSDD